MASERKPVGAVAAAAAVLRYLSSVKRPARLTEIATAAGLLPSTCLNILRTLTAEGMVMADAATKSYTLGYAVLDFARSLLRGDMGVQLIAPQMQTIADRYEVTTTLWRRVDDADIMFLAVVTGAGAIRLEADLGCRAPILNAAIGRLMAYQSGLDDAEVARRFAEVGWASDLTLETFLDEARQARAQGWSIDQGDYNPRLLSVAVSAPALGGLVDRGLTATMFVDQHPPAVVRQIAHDLHGVAAHLGHDG